MSNLAWRRTIVCVALSFLSISSSGCNPLAAIYFLLLLPPPKLPASCHALEGQTVVVLAYASHSVEFEHPGVDKDIVKMVVRHLRDNVPKIKIADPRDVRQWRDEHLGYELLEVGQEFEATRVLYLEIENFTLYEHQSVQLFRGRCKIRLQVADVEQDGEIVWEEIIEATYPGGQPIPADSGMSSEVFRLRFSRSLARRVAIRFFDHRPDDTFTLN